MKKTNNAEIERRIVTIYSLLCKGYSYTDIVEYCRQNYGVEKAITSRYIKRATDRIRQNSSGDIELLRSEATTRYLRWMRKYEEDGDFNEAARMQVRLDKINGLEEVKIKHSGEITSSVILPAEIEKRLIDDLKHYEK